MIYARPCRRCGGPITETKETTVSALTDVPAYRCRVECACSAGEYVHANRRSATTQARRRYWDRALKVGA